MRSLKSKLIAALKSNVKTQSYIPTIEDLDIPDNSNLEVFISVLLGILIPHSEMLHKKQFSLGTLKQSGFDELVKLDMDCLVAHRLTEHSTHTALETLGDVVEDYCNKVGIDPQQKGMMRAVKGSVLSLAGQVYSNLDQELELATRVHRRF